jgi:hypothetical protein
MMLHHFLILLKLVAVLLVLQVLQLGKKGKADLAQLKAGNGGLVLLDDCSLLCDLSLPCRSFSRC